MKKKHNNAAGHVNGTVPELPVVVNMDMLAYATDSEIESRYNMLNVEKQRVFNMGYDSYAWEVELAYVQREISIRDARRAAHEDYIKNNPDVDVTFSFIESDDFTVN